MSAKLEFARGEVIAEKYEVVDQLDESPLGVTYRCKHLKTGKYVRLQLLRPKVAGREHKEKIVAAFKKSKDLDHPHLVKLGDLGEIDGPVAFFTYEDFEGGTLRELLQEYKIGGKQFALKEAAQICIQILEGLSELHKAGVIVRALRPEYVLVNVRYTGPRKQTFVATTKVLNLAFWDLVPTAVLAEDEFTRGEAQYIAPELKSFDPTASARSDVYSVAVIFYELLCGAAPVGTFQDPKTRRPDLPEHVNTVVELGLSNSPEDRYPSTTDFIADLSRTFQDVPFEETARKVSILFLAAWLLAMLFVLFVAIIAFTFRADPEVTALAEDAAQSKEIYDRLESNKPADDEFRKVYERHPKNMIYVWPGPFVAGRKRADPLGTPNEPLAEPRETKGYMIDAFEYPNLKGQAQRLAVTLDEAAKLCEEGGKRLCTADEWERACKGPLSTIYSYGDTYDEEFCGSGLEDPYPSGTRPDCKSGYGAYDLSGSFREWTSTEVKKGRMLVKGGEKRNPEKGTRCAAGTDELRTYADKSLTFRCCRDADAPPWTPPPPPPAPVEGQPPPPP